MGDFTETADLGCPDSLTAPQAIFLAKYTQAGSCVWAKEFGGTATTHGAKAFGIAVNNAGDVAATGAFCGSISFGGETLSSASACDGMDVFAARFSGDGTHLKSVRAGGTEGDRGLGIAQSSDGRFFVTGEFAGFSEFGGDALNSFGGTDAFIAAYAPL